MAVARASTTSNLIEPELSLFLLWIFVLNCSAQLVQTLKTPIAADIDSIALANRQQKS